MKIEKLNDHQIRCTLTSEDLATRNIKLSELAYGSEKAKALVDSFFIGICLVADEFPGYIRIL